MVEWESLKALRSSFPAVCPEPNRLLHFPPPRPAEWEFCFEIGCPDSRLGNTVLVLKAYARGLKVDPQADHCRVLERNAFKKIPLLLSIGQSCKGMHTNFLKLLHLCQSALKSSLGLYICRRAKVPLIISRWSFFFIRQA